MGFVLAVTGAIGSGKTTLASRIAADRGALHLSSDAVRLSLSRRGRDSGERVFAELSSRFERALEKERSVVLDSTGMSHRFREILRTHRRAIVHVHLLLRDPVLFEQREAQRRDRSSGALSRTAFLQSQAVQFDDPPDVVVATDDLTPDDVHRIVLASAPTLGQR